MPDHRWLVMKLEAPLMAFGGVTIDQLGVTRAFPAASMLTGFFANALGYRRTDWEKHQALQDRLIFAVGRAGESASGLLTDTQNAKLEKTDRGWTTRGIVEGRDGASYGAPHRRKRDYHMDARVAVVLRLDEGSGGPDIIDLAEALDRPMRPLFIGRKPCLPAERLNGGFVEASDAHAALGKAAQEITRALWPMGEGPAEGPDVDRIVDLCDIRNWRTGLHGGSRKVVEGRIFRQESAP